ncbi:MAG TPA: HPr family phosphocarrier protein [Firmicutes bacterium]|uniref:Phosphocarrier protein HPr n=1 Tax=Candidatus Fermentithermobacillus carboniphilus TaxID=3085328 RepID=A0AAT9LAM2_9FIRM|nr:MAG: HPr family phosphocarrier protein [Candidatus Fermentithermobacillus carboniphilus]HHW17314.1 HPr family phosphocarrier protein [Candidatus Fermentithermobacillaceae bacterium]
MREAQVTVKNKVGLHARPAATFVQEATKFKSKINIECGGRKADGKSILQVLSLGVKCGSLIVIRADGEDEDEAVEKLVYMIEAGLGEEV